MAERTSLNSVVFKQSYKSKNLPSTPLLNQKHLIYIATRSGVMYNEGCGFGLWGKLPDTTISQTIHDLRIAKKMIGEASQSHTIYRAILSVSQETAKEHDLYSRATWQDLVDSRISVIRKEMDIKESNFKWVASMHYKKRHPHVHILYWDAGPEPRQEHIQKERFEIMAEHVRGTFSREIFREELQETQTTQKEVSSQLRLKLRSMLKEANIPEALESSHVKENQLDELGQELTELARTLPATGRLKYKLLPKPYKEKLNGYLHHLMQITDFAKLERKYVSLTNEISRLYGNGEKTAEHNQNKAHEKLYTNLGNEVLSVLKEVAVKLQETDPPQELSELYLSTLGAAHLILRDSRVYSKLRSTMPRWRTPFKILFQDDAFKKSFHQVTDNLTRDVRVRAKVDGYLMQKAEKKGGKVSAEEKKEAYANLNRTMNAVVLNALQEDSGYLKQRNRELAVMCLLRTFRSGSQGRGQMQSQRDLLRQKYRNLSETAQRDLKKKRQQEGGWSMEF